MTNKLNWKEPAHAISHSCRRYLYQVDIEMKNAGLKPSPILNEFHAELTSLMAQVWLLHTKESRENEIQRAIEQCTDDDVIRALEHMEGTDETFTYTPGITPNAYIIRLAMENGWEPYPEPSDQDLGLVGEPPISAKERMDIAWKEKIYAKS
jgi:hypothetical protein